MLDSGGMPSSHSATVSALAVAIGLQEGAGSSAFAVAVVLACIVCMLYCLVCIKILFFIFHFFGVDMSGNMSIFLLCFLVFSLNNFY